MEKITTAALITPAHPIKNPDNNTNKGGSNKDKIKPYNRIIRKKFTLDNYGKKMLNIIEKEKMMAKKIQ